MGWDKGGRYYTRSRRVNGRVVREYVGGGPVGELAAQLDARDRDKREAQRAAARAEVEEVAALDAPLAALDELADLVARAALAAAGYAQCSATTTFPRERQLEIPSGGRHFFSAAVGSAVPFLAA